MNYDNCQYTQSMHTLPVFISMRSHFLLAFLSIPSRLEGFNNSDTTVIRSVSDREVFCFNGMLELAESDRICPVCGGRMHINGHRELMLRHLCFGGSLSAIRFDRVQLVCHCGHSHMQTVPFKAKGH